MRKAPSAIRHPPSVPVLCYHRIGGPLELGVTRVSAGTFRRQMEHLARGGWKTFPLSQYAESLRTTHPVPRTFLLTFDDGYASLAEHAYPVLAELGFTATTFVITDYVGRTNTWDIPYAFRRLPHLDWDTMARWQDRGFEFQSHGARHERLTWLDDAAVSDDLHRSRQALIRHLGVNAGRAVAYPFGAVDARVAKVAEAAGYELGFGAVGAGPPGAGTSLMIPRVPVYLWDAFSVPTGLREDVWGRLGRGAAHIANRCAIGTSAMLGAWRAGLGVLRPAPQGSRQEDRAG